MKLIKASVCALALALATPIWAQTTIWGGFEDTTGSSSDYDYNDLVFSLTGTGLTLDSNGVWHSPSGLVLNSSGKGTPFWNNQSSDGFGDNVGYCIYGGGNCHGGTALDPGADYLATSNGHSVTDVTFSVDGQVDTTVSLTITADTDTLGWALLSSPNTIHTLGGVGTYSFTPGGDFELVGIVNGNTDYGSDTDSDVSQFAFFESPAAATPEPSSLMLLGSGLLGMAGVARRRFGRK